MQKLGARAALQVRDATELLASGPPPATMDPANQKDNCPLASIGVSGVTGEPGLNGDYQRNGSFGDRAQFMKVGTRCYIRFIRSRWELYVSHHPSGTTYFHHNSQSELPSLDGCQWTATEFSEPDDVLQLTAVPAEVEVSQPAGAPAEAPAEPEFVLWSNATCPFAQRVRIALHEKGVHAAEVLIDVVGDHEHDHAVVSRYEDFQKLWQSCFPSTPHRRPAIPMLQHKVSADAGAALLLPESAVIIDYLEDLQQGPPLLPPAASDRARVRLFRQVFERELGAIVHRIMGTTTADELFTASQELKQGLGAVDAFLQTAEEPSGAFVCPEFSQAEVYAAPDLQRLYSLVPVFRPELAQFLCRQAQSFPDAMAAMAPKFHAWVQAVLSRPSVQCTYDEAAVVALKRRAVARYEGEDR